MSRSCRHHRHCWVCVRREKVRRETGALNIVAGFTGFVHTAALRIIFRRAPDTKGVIVIVLPVHP
jgi:hypothetical protein